MQSDRLSPDRCRSKFIRIEAALGRNLHAVVLKDAQHAEEILARLTKKKLGQRRCC
jgi:chromosome segregation ATPase